MRKISDVKCGQNAEAEARTTRPKFCYANLIMRSGIWLSPDDAILVNVNKKVKSIIVQSS